MTRKNRLTIYYLLICSLIISATVILGCIEDNGSEVGALNSAVSETRCGWIENPTPANWWLTDNKGSWTMAVQGGYQAPGLDKLPDFGNHWVRTNGYYGYGCGCMNVKTDSSSKKILNILSAKVQDIKVCEDDHNIPKKPKIAGEGMYLCGWFDNPTPANYWLTDKFGEWTIAVQGGYQADGTENNIPDFGNQWKETNVHYGYGCACIDALVDKKSRQVISLEQVKVQPLTICNADPQLAKRLNKPEHKQFCGWIDNPTPANWWLTDKFGEWTISVQGGYQAQGTDYLPDFGTKWVKTNGNYGYGCGCVTAEVNSSLMQVTKISAATIKEISVCKSDPALPPR